MFELVVGLPESELRPHVGTRITNGLPGSQSAGSNALHYFKLKQQTMEIFTIA